MKKLSFFIVFFFAMLSLFSAKYVFAGSFLDDFDDGNHDGWMLNETLHPSGLLGNWRVEDGALVQDSGNDGVLAMLDGYEFSDQTTQVQLKLNGPSGGGGLVLWYQNKSNFVYVGVSNERIEVAEVEDGVWTSSLHDFDFNINENRWVNLKVTANSNTGTLEIYEDNELLIIENINTQKRSGLSGLVHGNAGGYFDNFSVNSSQLFDLSTEVKECKNNGWFKFTNFMFGNQGKCVSYIQVNQNAIN